MARDITLSGTDVLIVVDVQYDFLPGGALAVPNGDAVIAPINGLGEIFAHIDVTQDWHTPRHISFASSHPGKMPFETTRVAYGDQVLWPDHCVQGTRGAALSEALDLPKAEMIVRKGYNRDVDSYSAFLEANKTTRTGLAGYLSERGFRRVFVCGLATDYCVGWTAMDARTLGFDACVIEEACRGIDGECAGAWATMAGRGVERVSLSALL